MYCDRDDCSDPDCTPDEAEIERWDDPHAHTTPERRKQLRNARYNSWRMAQEQTQRFLDDTRKLELELASREPFDYSPADVKDMEQQITRVQLEAKEFASSYSADLLPAITTPLEARRVEEAKLNLIHHQLLAHVYGQTYKPIEVTHSTEVTTWVGFDEPSSWWQHVRKRLGRPYNQRHTDRKVTMPVTLTVAATPFSAFPELPYHQPKEWGPRIDMMLPSRVSWSSSDPRVTCG